jgi:hypothetical protein
MAARPIHAVEDILPTTEGLIGQGHTPEVGQGQLSEGFQEAGHGLQALGELVAAEAVPEVEIKQERLSLIEHVLFYGTTMQNLQL